jgi:hypothetical protein
MHQNYARDLMALRFGRVDDGVMEFARVAAPQRKVEREKVAS